MGRWCIESDVVFSDTTSITLTTKAEEIAYVHPNGFNPNPIAAVRMVAKRRQENIGDIRVVQKEVLSTEYGNTMLERQEQ